MKKFKVDMQKIFSVPFICYVYADSRSDAYELYQSECRKQNMMHYSGLHKTNIKKIGKTKRPCGLEFVHM